jgi:heme exporter protein A
MNPTLPMFEAQGLSAQRGGQWLFENIGFTLSSGDWLQVQGDNGSGKTTLLRMLAGLSPGSLGSLQWRGVSVRGDTAAFHRDLIYLGHQLGLKEELSAIENLKVASQLAQQALDLPMAMAALEALGLKGREHLALRVLSQGQKRRVALAKLMSFKASLWILDEPFVALDAQGLETLLLSIRQHLQGGGLLVYTSHQRVDLGAIRGWNLRLGS